MYNKLMVIGRITEDLELKSFVGKDKQSGSIVRFSLVSQNNPNAEPMYLLCTAFGKNAENLSSLCVKGTQLFLDGELKPNNYTDTKGVKHNSFSVVVNKFVITQQPQGYWETRQKQPAPPQQTPQYRKKQSAPPQQTPQYRKKQSAPPQQAQQYGNQQPAPPQQAQQYGNQQWGQQYNDFFEC